MTEEAFRVYRASRIFQIAKDAGGAPVVYSPVEIAAENAARVAAKANRLKIRLIWGAAILGVGGLLLYALMKK